MSGGEKKEKVVIAGGGLVGALAASAFADSGHEGKKQFQYVKTFQSRSLRASIRPKGRGCGCWSIDQLDYVTPSKTSASTDRYGGGVLSCWCAVS